jgi:hypothetical protein
MCNSIKTFIFLILFLGTSWAYSATVTQTNDYVFIGNFNVTNSATNGTNVVNWQIMTNFTTGFLSTNTPTLDQVTIKGNFTTNTIRQNVLYVGNDSGVPWPDDTNGSSVVGYNVDGTNAHDSVQIGFHAAMGMDNHSPYIGGGTNSWHSEAVGSYALMGATRVHRTAAIGLFAGANVMQASGSAGADARSGFYGAFAGMNSRDSWRSVHIGYKAGAGNLTTPYSVWIQPDNAADYTIKASGATNCSYTVAIGYYALNLAKNCNDAIGIGQNAGDTLLNSVSAICIGQNAGRNAKGAGSDIFIGNGAGQNIVSNTPITYIGNGLTSNAATVIRTQAAFAQSNTIEILGNGQSTYFDDSVRINGFYGGTSNMLWYSSPTNFLAFWCLGLTNYLGYMSNGIYTVTTNAFILNTGYNISLGNSTGSVSAITNSVLYFPFNTQSMSSIPSVELTYIGTPPTNAVTPTVISKTLTNFMWYSKDGYGSKCKTNAVIDWKATTSGYVSR